MGAKTGLVQPPAWAWSCPLPAQSARTQKARGGCTQQSQGQGGGTLLGSLLPAPLTISTADFPTFPPWEHLAVCFGSKPDLRASGSAVLGKTPSSSCAQQCPHPASAPRVCAPRLRPASAPRRGCRRSAGFAPIAAELAAGRPPWDSGDSFRRPGRISNSVVSSVIRFTGNKDGIVTAVGKRQQRAGHKEFIFSLLDPNPITRPTGGPECRGSSGRGLGQAVRAAGQPVLVTAPAVPGVPRRVSALSRDTAIVLRARLGGT